MNLKPWAKMPTHWIQDGGLKDFRWKDDGSAGTAALMIYFALCQYASERPLRPSEIAEPKPAPPGAGAMPSLVPNRLILSASSSALKINTPTEKPDQLITDSLVARLTYDDLNALTELSRDRISAGLKNLIDKKMIWCADSSSSYGLHGFGPSKRWVKLPGRALMPLHSGRFTAFTHFSLRSKHELNALKLHLYYAHARSHELAYTEATYPTIFEKTGVPERDIARANSLLLTTGILQRTRGSPISDVKQYESNKYHLTGHESFFIQKAK